MSFRLSRQCASLSVVPLVTLAPYSFVCSGPRAAAWAHAKSHAVVASKPVKVAQVVGEFDREMAKPTENRTMSRYKLYLTDLGDSFRHNGWTHLLFGDTDGANGGDAIAYVAKSSPQDSGSDSTSWPRRTDFIAPCLSQASGRKALKSPWRASALGEKSTSITRQTTPPPL